MEKILTSFLITLLLVTPIMACCCPDDFLGGVEALEQVKSSAEHQHGTHHASEKQLSHHCSGSSSQLSQQIISSNPFELTEIQFLQHINIHLAHEWSVALTVSTAYDDPFIESPPSSSQPIYLMTQRLRI